MDDTIYRQAAIDALNRHLDTIRVTNNSTTEMIRRSEVMDCREIINGLPSAQPKPCQNHTQKAHESDTLGVKTVETCSDTISRKAAIDAINKAFERVFAWDGTSPLGDKVLENVPSARSEPHYDEWCDDCKEYDKERHCCPRWNRVIRQTLKDAQPEQRYTEEELRVFKHGISLSLLSKRSSQHWQYDEDTATEIEFLERLYDKVSADMRGEQDDESRSNSNAQTDTRARGMGATDKSSGI